MAERIAIVQKKISKYLELIFLTLPAPNLAPNTAPNARGRPYVRIRLISRRPKPASADPLVKTAINDTTIIMVVEVPTAM